MPANTDRQRRDARAHFARRHDHINVQLNVDIPAPLRQDARAEAERLGMTLTEFVKEALRLRLSQAG